MKFHSLSPVLSGNHLIGLCTSTIHYLVMQDTSKEKEAEN